jgi:uncharacterized protein YndB with AHSA1/START domain
MGDLVLELSRTMPAPRGVVYAAFRDSEQLARWWGPEGFTIPSVDWSTLTGEAYRIEMQPPAGDAFFLHGVFRTVHPPERLAFTFNWEPPDPDDVERLADLTFAGDDDTTEVSLWLGVFRTDARLEVHHHEWTDTFNRLERYLRT